MVTALPCVLGQQVLVASVDCHLCSAENCSEFFSSCCTPGSCISSNGQLAPAVTAKGLKAGTLKVGVEQRELLESLICENEVEQKAIFDTELW